MILLRDANERGHANHGWLDSYHTFSFADYHDPKHMGFRALRVINEDRVEGGKGFGTHPHRDFEIISYVVGGALQHRDSMGHSAVMRAGEVQRISAGTGISHSEFNHSQTELVHFLQIWLHPFRAGTTPSYAQKSFSSEPPSALTLACSVDGRAGSIQINQEADLYIGRLDPKESITHLFEGERFAWVQLIEGDLDLNGNTLKPGDGAAVEKEASITLQSETKAHFLLFDLK
jgi:redox-sensitive bicupin YhaK (pirin superfamily)